MDISLTPELERFASQKLESGAYHSASEVIHDGLLLLKEKEEEDRIRLKALRKEIAVGLEQAERGELLDGDEVFRRLRNKIQQDSCPNP